MALVDSSQMQPTQFSSSGVLSSLGLPPTTSLPSSLQGIASLANIVASNADDIAADLNSALATSSAVSVGKRSGDGSAGVNFPLQTFQLQHRQSDLNSVLQQQPQLAEGCCLPCLAVQPSL